jgi:hypothetical protein
LNQERRADVCAGIGGHPVGHQLGRPFLVGGQVNGQLAE